MRRPSPISFALALLLTAPPAHGSEPLPRDAGPPFEVIAGDNAAHPSLRPEGLVRGDGEGGWWIAFAGPDSGARVIRVDGALRPRPGFGPRGRAITAAAGFAGQPSQLLDDGEAGVYALWETGYSIQARRLLPDGDFVPGWENAFLHWAWSPGFRSGNPSAVSLGADGVMMAQDRAPLQAPVATRMGVTTQHFRADGSSPFLWDPVYARLVTPAPWVSMVETCGDAAGGMYAAWFERDTLTDSTLLRLMRCRPTSVPSPGWSPRGTVVDRFPSLGVYDFSRPPRLSPDGAGGVVVVWAHTIRGVRAQRFLGDSLPRWGEGGRQVAIGSASDARIAPGPTSSWYVAWSEGTRKWVTRLEGDGAPNAGWPSPRLLLDEAAAHGTTPWIAPDGAGGLYAAQLLDWTAPPDSRRPLRLLRLAPDGGPAPGWGARGLVCRDVVATQWEVVVGASPTGLLALWTHSKDGSFGPVMALLVSPEGVPIDPDTRLPPALAVLSAGPNPMQDDHRLRFRSGRSQRLDADVHDLSGRRVRVLARGWWLEPGDHEIRWDGRDALGARVRPGVYVIRLRSTAGLASRRVVAGL